MKASKILSLGIAAVALVQTASADVTIRITGSSAFRSAASHAIQDLFLKSGNTYLGVAFDGTGTDFSGANFQIFKGTIGTIQGGTGTVIVKTNWSGSVEGIRDIAATPPNNIAFIADATAVATGNGTNGATATVNEQAQIALSDARQSSTKYKAGTTAGVVYATLTATKVGIVPFAFVANFNAPAAITNVTSVAEKRLLEQGGIPTAFLVPGSTDQTPIYGVGRYFGSGTRLTTLAEVGYGTLTLVQQFAPVGTVTAGVVGHIDLDANQDDGTGGGQTSGGTVANFLRDDTSNIIDDDYGHVGAAGFLGALGESDSYAAVWNISPKLPGAGNARYLTYNGTTGFGGHAYKQTIATTVGSNVITVPTTAGVIAGQIVTLPGFVAAGSVVSVTPAAGDLTLTLDKNAVATTPVSTPTGIIGSLLPNQLRNGQYTFWNYEQYLINSLVTGDVSTYSNLLSPQISTVDYVYSGLLDDATFKVQRFQDGGPVSPKGTYPN